MNESPLTAFFGVVVRSRTWLNMLFQWLAFPLGLFYFIFLITGLSLGIGLVIVWVGIPILLIVAGAWWLFGAFERVQARYLLRAAVAGAPREWEKVNGVWAKLKAHFGSAATWKDLVYLLAKMPFGVASFGLLMTVLAGTAWLFGLPVAAMWDLEIVTWTSDGGTVTVGWTPSWWLGVLGIPLGILWAVAGLHVVNAWGWVCARWAEVLFGTTPQAGQAAPPAPLTPIVTTGAMPQAPAAPPPAVVPPAPEAEQPQVDRP
jgi:hypothetical protein